MSMCPNEGMIATNGLVFRQLRFEDALRSFESIGVDGFELPHPIFYTGMFAGSISSSLNEMIEDISALASTKLRIVSVNAGNDFLRPDGASFRKEIDKTKVCIDTAQALGVPLVRIFMGEPKEGLPPERCFELTHTAIAELCAYADKAGVVLALENHGRYSNDVNTINAILSRVGSANLKLNIDTGNFYWFGYSLQETENILDSLSSLAAHTHLKNEKAMEKEKRRAPGEVEVVRLWEGDINIARFVRKLVGLGYKGAFSAEFEFKGMSEMKPSELNAVLREDIERLRRVVASS